jgi:UDP-3-O-[3-hydroxymyristoyl] glucosamine N-acyltransferase
LKTFTLSEILSWTQGRVINTPDKGGVDDQLQKKLEISKPAPLGTARDGDIAFFFAKEYQADLMKSRPTILVTGEAFVEALYAHLALLPFWKSAAVVACKDPYLAMAVVSEKLAPGLSTMAHVPPATGQKSSVHPTAIVDSSAEVGDGVVVGAYVVISARAKIGAGTFFYPHTYVGHGAEIGESSVVFSGVSIYERVRIGKNARIHAGTVIGSDGFGFAPKKNEKGEVVGHQKIYHLGRVVIGDDFECGANVCIDRGTMGDTVVGNHVKLDNDVHLGHNSVIEDGVMICGGTAVAGSAGIGKYSYIGGLTGVTKVQIGERSSVGAVSIVTKDIPPGGTAVGVPQRNFQDHFKVHAFLNRLALNRKRKKSPEDQVHG